MAAERKLPAPAVSAETQAYWDAAAKGKPLIISTGMANLAEIEAAKDAALSAGAAGVGAGAVGVGGVGVGAVGGGHDFTPDGVIRSPRWRCAGPAAEPTPGRRGRCCPLLRQVAPTSVATLTLSHRGGSPAALKGLTWARVSRLTGG